MFLVLGSKSPRRKEILKQAGYKFQVNVSNVSEDVAEILPEEKVLAIAKKKGLDIFSRYNNPDVVVLSADTIVVVDNEILGKPKDIVDARRMIHLLAGKKHSVYTAVYIQSVFKNDSFVEKTEVEVSSMTDEEIESYIQTKEPYDKAGGYAIQGIFSKYIMGINGDYYNVMGLPIYHVHETLKQYDFSIKKYCTNCHALITEDEKFCIECGKQNDEEIECSNCHHLNSNENKYCVACGYEIRHNDSLVLVCPVCQQVNEQNNEFCVSCGTRLINNDIVMEDSNKIKQMKIFSQVSFVTGILAIILCFNCLFSLASFILAPCSLIFGIISVKKGDVKKSRTGIILSILTLIILILLYGMSFV